MQTYRLKFLLPNKMTIFLKNFANKRWMAMFLLTFNLLIIMALHVYAQERAQERERMVQQQLVSRGIRSKVVLDAMRKVERHRFVPRN